MKHAKHLPPAQKVNPIGLRITKRTLYVTIFLVCSLVGLLALSQWRQSSDRQAFERVRATNASIAEEVTKSIGKPMYVDNSNTCFKRSPEEFSGKKLFCDVSVEMYYKVSSEDARSAALTAKAAIERHFSITLEDYRPKTPGMIEYSTVSHTEKGYNGLNCAMGIYYPQDTRLSSSYTPEKFTSGDVLNIGIDCDKQVPKAFYPMVNY